MTIKLTMHAIPGVSNLQITHATPHGRACWMNARFLDDARANRDYLNSIGF